MKKLPDTILQFYKHGEILEQYYNDNAYPVDFDLNGKLYKLNTNSNNTTRSTVFYHPRILQHKWESIKDANDLIHTSQTKMYINAGKILDTYYTCEAKLVDLVQTGCTDVLSPNIAQEITIEMFYKCSASMLSAFIKVRVLKNLLDTYMIPNKGKSGQVCAGDSDKNKGSIYDCISLSG